MNKLILGIAIGAVLGYCARSLQEKGQWDNMGDDINKLKAKGKRKFNNLLDSGKNKAEYVKDRVEYKIQKGKENLDDIIC